MAHSSRKALGQPRCFRERAAAPLTPSGMQYVREDPIGAFVRSALLAHSKLQLVQDGLQRLGVAWAGHTAPGRPGGAEPRSRAGAPALRPPPNGWSARRPRSQPARAPLGNFAAAQPGRRRVRQPGGRRRRSRGGRISHARSPHHRRRIFPVPRRPDALMPATGHFRRHPAPAPSAMTYEPPPSSLQPTRRERRRPEPKVTSTPAVTVGRVQDGAKHDPGGSIPQPPTQGQKACPGMAMVSGRGRSPPE
jgi:hypothetical protein